VILGLKYTNVAVGQRKVEEPKEPGLLPRAEFCGGRDGAGDAVPLQGRTFQPEQSDLGLLGGTGAGGGDSVPAAALDLMEIGRVPPVGDGIGRSRSKLGGVVKHEGRQSAQLRHFDYSLDRFFLGNRKFV